MRVQPTVREREEVEGVQMEVEERGGGGGGMVARSVVPL